MSFQPVLPLGGYAGWVLLQNTIERQTEAYSNSPVVKTKTTYFVENISKINSAEELVSDRRLLEVALGAFGLHEEIDNTYFIRKVLEDGTTADESLAKKLSNKAFFAFSEAFGFGDGKANTTKPGFSDRIVAAYQTQRFEISVGEQDESYRIALNGQRELSALAESPLSDDAKWYSVMASGPLRAYFEIAFGLPHSFSTLDLEDQLRMLRDQATAMFGSGEVSQFQSEETRDDLNQLFLLKSQIARGFGIVNSQYTALVLLSSGDP
ncbi:uncharacterized protein DUF1217 [Aliiruegeria haliotis]|uniref:Uncharacterized protein DUF1217 n=1 Tax=Aliiruegeria haliotis TaxID=1280846 RepID=A0A2T0RE30_9RHOB|nr:DUF1217 domain-containing protein [Aliiruegeria haliotis]PRY19454.1 uncharacterized protein DUF1217 [Aliiruegeria haliotis]